MNLLDVRKSSTRGRVLETAKILFAQKGYSACSMRELATRAKVNEVTVFRLFGTKQRLYAEVLKDAADSSRIGNLLSPENGNGPRLLEDRKLREVATLLGDSLFLRLFLFGILEQPEVTMKELSEPLQSLSSQLCQRFQSSGIGTLPLKDVGPIVDMMEALALFHQCSNKLVNEKRRRKKLVDREITKQVYDAWLAGIKSRKNGTDNLNIPLHPVISIASSRSSK